MSPTRRWVATVQEVRVPLSLSEWGGFATYPSMLRREMALLSGTDWRASSVQAGDRLIQHPRWMEARQRSRLKRRLLRTRSPLSGISRRFADSYLTDLVVALKRYSPDRPSIVYHQMNSFELPPPEIVPLSDEFNVRLCTTLIDLQEHNFPYFFSQSEWDRRQRNYEISLGLASSIVTASQFLVADGKKILGIRPELCHVAPLGSDHVPCHDLLHEVSVRTRMHIWSRFVYMPLTPWRHKGFLEYLRALDSREINATVVIPGNTESWDRVLDGRDRKWKHIRVVFPGFLADREHFTLMQRAAVVAFPSLYEGFGLPYIEAARLGSPLVAFRTQALSDIMGDLVDGLPDVGDFDSLALMTEQILRSGEGLVPYLGEMKERARSFAWKRTAMKTLEAYEQAACV